MDDDLHVDPTRIYTTPEFTLGQRLMDHQGFEYMFVYVPDVQFANMGRGDGAAINELYEARRLAAGHGDVGDMAGVAITAIHRGHYGWISIYGVGVVDATRNTAAHTNLYTSSGGRVVGRIDKPGAHPQHLPDHGARRQ